MTFCPLLRHPQRLTALSLLLFAGLADPATLYAAPSLLVNAENLDLSVPCVGEFVIKVDPAINDGVAVDGTAALGAHLLIRTNKSQGLPKVQITSQSCAPDARVSIMVAPNVGVLIHDSQGTHIVIDGTLASLEASLETGQLDADAIQSLDLSIHGSEQVHIQHLNRAAQIVEDGASSLLIDQADLDAFSGQLSGSSKLAITKGRLDVLTLLVNNDASAWINGTANTATIAENGNGSVTIKHVTGALTKTGNVQIGSIAKASIAITPVTVQPSAPISGSSASPSTDTPVTALAAPSRPPAGPDLMSLQQADIPNRATNDAMSSSGVIASQRIPETTLPAKTAPQQTGKPETHRPRTRSAVNASTTLHPEESSGSIPEHSTDPHENSRGVPVPTIKPQVRPDSPPLSATTSR